MTFQSSLGHRIIILGNAGSGKTTLAEHLSRSLGYPHTELDSLYWDANWTAAAPELFRERVSRVVAGERWVLDGNYSSVRDLLWGRADTAIWLDYSLPLVLWRLLKRTLRRTLSREELWNGNRERFSEQLFSQDSLFLYVLKTYKRRRRQFETHLGSAEYAHLAVIHLRSPQQTNQWLRNTC